MHATPRLARPRLGHTELIASLSRKSVHKHFDAYADVDWDAPANQVRADDPRWILTPQHALGATLWYQSLTALTQAQIGLHLVTHQLKTGVFFENVLSRGLLEFAAEQPNRSPAFRYAYHEVIEESQHSLMFQELINRTRLDVRGIVGLDRWASRGVVRLGGTFPELFFLFVLGGEAPIDFMQRRDLASGRDMHPLLERIMRIHVLEEARHLSFANSFLRDRVPRLGAWPMWHLRLRTPLIMRRMSEQMLGIPREIVSAYDIPRDTLDQVRRSPEHRQGVLDSLASVRDLCADIGVITPATVALWRALGIWDDRVCGTLSASL
jgi:hypothetical protein